MSALYSFFEYLLYDISRAIGMMELANELDVGHSVRVQSSNPMIPVASRTLVVIVQSVVAVVR